MLHTAGGFVVVAILIGVLVEIGHEAKRVPCIVFSDAMRRKTILKGIAVISGALVTYTLSCNIGMGQ